MTNNWDLGDYTEVKDRIPMFYAQYPNGALQSEVVELTDVRVTVKAWAYRTPDDPRPGIGHSFVNIPGATKFTRGSEIENAETSAWGRALAAIGIAVGKSVASRDEINSKQGEWERPDARADQRRPTRPPEPRNAQNRPVAASDAERDAFVDWAYNTHGLGLDVVLGMLKIEPARFMVLTADELKRASLAIEAKISGVLEEQKVVTNG